MTLLMEHAMKTQDDYFRDWEGETFGYGYGSGEEFIVPALKAFMNQAHGAGEGTYDHNKLEVELGGAVTWLLINALCHADIIEYGSSPRFGWLTQPGERLKEYVDSKSSEELQEVLDVNEYNGPCYTSHCNCEGEECRNPFWRLIKPRSRN